MAIDENSVILLTRDAYDKMKKELEEREGPIREDIVQKIAVARAEGDLRQPATPKARTRAASTS